MLSDDFNMECYICTDKCDTLSPCTCEQLYLHQDCYAKLLAYDHKKCTVCNTPFPLEIESQHENSIGSTDSMEDEDEVYIKPSGWWVLVPLYLRPRDVWVLYEADILFELLRTPIWLVMFMTFWSIAYLEPIWNDWYNLDSHMELYISALVSMILVSIFVKSFCISHCCC
jgi:hypothetical protein